MNTRTLDDELSTACIIARTNLIERHETQKESIKNV